MAAEAPQDGSFGWIWTAISMGDIRTLQRLEHKLAGFDFNSVHNFHGTVFMAFFAPAFCCEGMFSADDAECRQQVRRLSQFLLAQGADPTVRAPHKCTESFHIEWLSGGTSEEESVVNVGYDGLSPLELLTNLRSHCRMKLGDEPRWSETVDWIDFVMGEITAAPPRDQRVAISASVLDLWEHIIDDDEAADAWIMCRPEDARVPCHKVILRAMSPVLRAMLTSGFHEGSHPEIAVDETAAAVRVFLKLAATGCIYEGVSVPMLIGALDLAHRWQVVYVVSLIGNHLCILPVDDEHFPAVFEAAVLKELPALRRACLQRCLQMPVLERSLLDQRLPSSVKDFIESVSDAEPRRSLRTPI